EADVDAPVRNQGVEALRLGLNITLAIDGHELDLAAERGNEALAQITSEARRMRLAQPDIFVEMKGSDPGPVDALGLDQMGQDLELAGACGNDDIGVAASGLRLADGLCAERRGLGAE